MQYNIDKSIISAAGGSKSVNISLSMQGIPTRSYTNDTSLNIFQYISLYIMVIYIFCAAQIIKDIVDEKENRLKVSCTEHSGFIPTVKKSLFYMLYMF